MDRKTSSIITDISKLNKDINHLKTAQPFGYDSSELKLGTNANTYDLSISLTSGSRATFDMYCWALNDVYPFNIHRGYNQILFQIWLGNMSTPYYGESSGIGVFTPISTNSPFAPRNDMLTVELINSNAGTTAIYIKVYAVSTLQMPTVSIYRTS